RPVILAFYPADWSPVCGDQMALYNELGDEFGRFHAWLLGISVDGVWCHAAFARDRKLHFPLLADFEPKCEVARRYVVYRTAAGLLARGRRLRVPRLRAGPSALPRGAEAHGPPPAPRLPQLPARRNAPARGEGRGDGGGRSHPGQVLGDARPALREPGRARGLGPHPLRQGACA